jgi:4-amino-4-deoxy-L-arabinose transferase-like glycosyltransferase
MGLVLLALGAAGVGLSATAVAASLRLRSATSFLLASFLVGWAIVLALTFGLSAFRIWTAGWMLASIAAVTAAAVVVWDRHGRPSPPPVGLAIRSALAELRDPPLALLGLAVGAGWAYLAVVGIVIPPMDWDALMYHLPRIVFWMEQHGVGAVPNAGTSIVAHPPGAEIVQGTTMLLSGGDRWVWLLQWLCGWAGALAVAGTARRLGVDRRAALFCGLVLLTFPIVAVQAATAYNDLAVAAALLAACYFSLGREKAELGLASLALAIALTTKISAILALPALALFVLVATPRGRRVPVVVSGLVGCLLGCGWYVWNLARTGSWDGGLADEFDQIPSRAPLDILTRAERYAVDSLDLSGVVGRDRWMFPILGVAIVLGALLVARRGGHWLTFVVAGACVAVVPWIVIGGHELVVRTFARGWIAIGKEDSIGFLPSTVATRASPPESWFGPLLVPLGIVAVLAVARRRPTRPTRTVVLTACLGVPAVLLLTNSAAFEWQDQRGRFFVFGAAIATVGFATVARYDALRWAAAGAAGLSLGLALVHFTQRPMGIELLQPASSPSVWGAPRWETQSAFSRDSPEVGEALRRVALDVPAQTAIALGRSVQAPYYQVLGSGPWRRPEFVPPSGIVPADASFVALPLDAAPVDLPPTEWRLIPGTGVGQAWRVYRRVG